CSSPWSCCPRPERPGRRAAAVEAELLAGQVQDGQARAGRALTGQPRAWLWGTGALSAGAFGAAVVLAPPASAAPVRGLAWLLFLGSSVHVAATGWLYTLPDVRAHAAARPLRYAWVPAGLVVTGGVTAAVLSPAAMAWLLLAYFGWQFFHFQKQNPGRGASWGCRPLPVCSSSGCAREPASCSPWPGCSSPPGRGPGRWPWPAARLPTARPGSVPCT